MPPDDKREPKLIHVRQPGRRVKLTFEPVAPVDGPVTPGPLIHVRYPAVKGVLTFEPVEPATLEAAHPAPGAEGGQSVLGTLNALAEKVNETESLFHRPGLRVDAARSGVRDGRVVLVLTPNDPADAVETCKRVADFLFAAIRTIPGATVRVFTADQPNTPVYELAS